MHGVIFSVISNYVPNKGCYFCAAQFCAADFNYSPKTNVEGNWSIEAEKQLGLVFQIFTQCFENCILILSQGCDPERG